MPSKHERNERNDSPTEAAAEPTAPALKWHPSMTRAQSIAVVGAYLAMRGHSINDARVIARAMAGDTSVRVIIDVIDAMRDLGMPLPPERLPRTESERLSGEASMVAKADELGIEPKVTLEEARGWRERKVTSMARDAQLTEIAFAAGRIGRRPLTIQGWRDDRPVAPDEKKIAACVASGNHRGARFGGVADANATGTLKRCLSCGEVYPAPVERGEVQIVGNGVATGRGR